jgi:hypothetical protein
MVTTSTSCFELTLSNYAKRTIKTQFKTYSGMASSVPFLEVNILKVIQRKRSMSLTGQFASLLNRLGLAWWVEVTTQSPACVYYFGPFNSAKEAEIELPGFLEDLEDEKAQGIQAVVKRCQPSELTVFDDVDSFSAQRQRLSQQVP